MVTESDVIRDAKKENDYMRMVRLRQYVEKHESDFPDPEYLWSIIDEEMQHKFLYPQCSQLRNLSILTKGMSEFVNLGMDRAMSDCSTAEETMDVSLKDWLYESYPDLISFKVDIARPTQYEKEMAESLLPSVEQRAGKIGIRRATEQVEGNEIRVEIDAADLMRRYQDETRELIEASKEDNLREMERLRKEINALSARIEAGHDQVAQEAPQEISRVLDSSQYQYFLRNAYKLELPVRYEQIARGQYRVSVTGATGADRDKILQFLTEAETHEREITHAHKTHLNGYEDILRALCRNYEKASGMPCGLSRTGALSTLADRMLEYASSQGIDWQAAYDAESMDLFAKRGQIYTREQADEAFNNLIDTMQGKKLIAEEAAENEACSDEVVTDTIIDYDAYLMFSADYPAVSGSALPMRNDAVAILTGCGLYPNRLNDAREIASAFYASVGTDYDTQVTARYDALVRMYGGNAS